MDSKAARSEHGGAIANTRTSKKRARPASPFRLSLGVLIGSQDADMEGANRVPGTIDKSFQPPHLCEALTRVLGDPCSNFVYESAWREYHILRSPQEIPPDELDDPEAVEEIHGDGRIVMEYCPFDGVKFPDSLDDEWLEQIWVLGLEPDSPDLPRRFTDATWWEEAGL